ncbi:hypothetical protein BKA61DRAFT_740190 [Leptodontidium sp. MPI-SDFR-AT-0119]|nr:hypothetical protein BKA61DRAFT_740190 [Leptodontidium sp. MPI-SDFR-AT-0119]
MAPNGRGRGERARIQCPIKEQFRGVGPYENVTGKEIPSSAAWLGVGSMYSQIKDSTQTLGPSKTYSDMGQPAPNAPQGSSARSRDEPVVVGRPAIPAPQLNCSDSKNDYEFKGNQPKMAASGSSYWTRATRASSAPTETGNDESSEDLRHSISPKNLTRREDLEVCDIGECGLSFGKGFPIGNHKGSCDGHYRSQAGHAKFCRFETSTKLQLQVAGSL